MVNTDELAKEPVSMLSDYVSDFMSDVSESVKSSKFLKHPFEPVESAAGGSAQLIPYDHVTQEFLIQARCSDSDAGLVMCQCYG